MTADAPPLPEHRTAPTPSLSVVILTLNETRHIGRAIDSARGVAARIFVVDSFSSDDTVATATALGAEVVQHPFENYSRQYAWALARLPIDTDWVMRLDADEVVSPELAREIARTLPGLPPDVTGVVVPLSYVFLGRRMGHGGRRLRLLRITRRNAARIEDRWMDEHLVLDRGRTVRFRGELVDHNLNTLDFFVDKHNRYATREAVDVLLTRHALIGPATSGGLASQAARTRRAKDLYYALPFGIGPAFYLLYRYVLRLGFLDGIEGLIYHVLQGFWYRFLVDCKIREWDERLRELADPGARLRTLERLTGLVLTGPAEPAGPRP